MAAASSCVGGDQSCLFVGIFCDPATSLFNTTLHRLSLVSLFNIDQNNTSSTSTFNGAMVATSQPISIARDQRSQSNSSAAAQYNNGYLAVPAQQSHLHPSFAGSPMHTSGSALLHAAHHFANPRYAGTSPRSAESSTSWSIHPGPLFVSAGSLGSTSGSLGANSVVSGSAGSFKARYPGLGCSPANVVTPLEPDFKFRGIVGSFESDHGSLINPHMSEREVEQFRNFSCCGLPLGDLHALVEHFETHHILLVDPLNPFQLLPQNHLNTQNAFSSPTTSNTVPASTSQVSNVLTSSDSSLAGALGPSTSSPIVGDHSTNGHGSTVAAGFDLDDMELDMDPEPETDHATSPAPSASSSSQNSNSIHSNRSSPLGAGSAGPLPLTQPQRFANANVNGGGTMSSVSSPPDTPLLTTPVSPFASAPPLALGLGGSGTNVQPGFFGQGQALSSTLAQGQQQGQEGLVGMGMASNIQAQQMQGQQQQQQAQGQQQPQQHVSAGPAAFDTVHLPAKPVHGGMFAHPYAGAASSARRHATHPLSPLSSASTSGANSPASASATSSGFGFGGGFQNHQHGPEHGLHHTQSLYALRFARQLTEQRELEKELVQRAMNGYAGYEDYSRGFPGTGELANQVENVGIAGNGGGAAFDGMGDVRTNASVGPTESAIHPGLLFGNASANGVDTNGGVKTEPATARTSPVPSRSGSPSSFTPALASTSTSTSANGSASSSNGTTRKLSQSSTTVPRPSSSLLLSKPFKCPTPGCTKSYKQANGLKYHVTHGQCSFTPPPEYSSISELGLSMGVNLKLGPMGLEGLDSLSEKERREAEREAERRLRPFCCQVKPCTRRYKNMNGLRYHYQHSGEHGTVGLRMLAEGRHDATRSQSVERSDEEEYRETQQSVERSLRAERGEGKEGKEGEYSGTGVAGVIGTGERGRRKEKKDSFGASNAQGGQTNSAPNTPGASQVRGPFTTQAFTFHPQHQHQRSLSGSSSQQQQQQQQPRSPLSQQFPPPTMTASQYAALSNGMNGMNGFAFAVQSQPASAYASPWGSRAGSPTSSSGTGTSGQWASPGQTQAGQSQDPNGMVP